MINIQALATIIYIVVRFFPYFNYTTKNAVVVSQTMCKLKDN